MQLRFNFTAYFGDNPVLHLETRLVQAPHGGRAASFLGFGGSRAMAVAKRARRAAGTIVLAQPTMPGR